MPYDTVWYTRCPVPSALGIAARFGWIDTAFGAHRITVKSIGESRDTSVRESHFTHTLPWSFRQGGNIPAIRARSDGRDTRLIGLTWVDEFQAMITLPQSSLKTGTDLKGARIGVPRRPGPIVDFHRATALKGIVSALAVIGATVEDVTLVDLEIGESVITQQGDAGLHGLSRRQPYWAEIAALANGAVDTVFVKGGEGISIANLLGARVLVETGHHPDPNIRINNGTPRTLTVDASFIEERPDLAAVLVAEVDRAAAWARVNPGETRRIIAREVLVSEEAASAAYGEEAHLKLGLSLDPGHVSAIAHFKDFLLARGFLDNDFDVDAWVDRRPADGRAAQPPDQNTLPSRKCVVVPLIR
jgi:ABC-type nitrate/sulfonate/bicarbonate transport system substrate-binding protein